MTNITRLRCTPSIAFRYKQGDITRALLEGLRHEQVAADVEDVLSALLFSADDHAISNARDMLADLLAANIQSSGAPGQAPKPRGGATTR